MHITIPYAPRSVFIPFHESTNKRWKALVCHRRAGKTIASINELIKQALIIPLKSPRLAYISPYRPQSKAVAWDALLYYTSTIPDRVVNVSELYVKFTQNDAKISLYGADNAEALRGIYLDFIVIDEPADQDPTVWSSIIRPALSDRKGSAVWIGTPKGRNAFFRLYDRAVNDPDWYSMILPASVSGIIDENELRSARNSMLESEYNREFECSFEAAIPGSIYGDAISKLRANNQIQDYQPDADLPYDTFWDVGDSDYTCIWLVQFEGRHINIVDYYSSNGQTIGHYAAKVLEWGDKYHTTIRTHFLPHDATHERRGGSWKTDLNNAGLSHITIVPRTPDIWLGINELRTLLLRCYIHKTNCSKTFGNSDTSPPSGIDCLEYYHKKEEVDRHVIYEKPVHDEFSHGADALRTMSEAHRLGMIEGTSFVARESRHTPHKVLRGPSAASYSVKKKNKSLR